MNANCNCNLTVTVCKLNILFYNKVDYIKKKQKPKYD